MKKTFYILLIVPVLLTGCSELTVEITRPVNNDQPQQAYTNQPQTEQVFYDELSPYGQWIDYPDYGYVWHPNVDADFRPYVTDGNWVYTDYGWTWASNFNWGWAPFHYGNWFYDDDYGWLWEPGQQWGPAWVTWGQSDNYYGWVCVPPYGNSGNRRRLRDEDWNYVPASKIGEAYVRNFVVRKNTVIFNNIKIINNVPSDIKGNKIMYNRGPDIKEVENTTNTKIRQVTISENTKPGQSFNNNQLNVYRPAINHGTVQSNNKPAPQKVSTYKQGNNPNPYPQQNARQGNNPNPNQQRNAVQVNNPNPNPQQNAAQGNNPNSKPQQNAEKRTGGGFFGRIISGLSKPNAEKGTKKSDKKNDKPQKQPAQHTAKSKN